MKITDKEIKKIIKEVLEDQEKLGKTSISATERSKGLRKKASDSSMEQGYDNIERGIVTQFENRLAELAKVSNIKSGKINQLLKKIYALMDEEIQKIKNKGTKQDEK